VSAQASEGAVWWPSTNPSIDSSGVVVATVNYNTKRLVSMLLWSLYRLLGSELRSVVVVDNGSSDGSTEILQAYESSKLGAPLDQWRVLARSPAAFCCGLHRGRRNYKYLQPSKGQPTLPTSRLR